VISIALPLALTLAACSAKPAADESPDGVTETGTAPPTGETGTGGTGGLDCTDGVWLPGAFWELDTSVPVDPPREVADLAIDAGAVPVVLSTRAGALVVEWREPGEAADTLPHSVEWTGVGGRAPWGAALGLSGGGFLVGGHLSDGAGAVPFAVALDRSGAATPVILDETMTEGGVTAGPVVTAEGTWWLGAADDALVLWRVDGSAAVHEALRVEGALPGALTATGDGRVLVGGGSADGAAWLRLGDADGLDEVLSLDGGGTIAAAAVAGERLVYAWSAVDVAPEAVAGPSWRLYDGLLADPGGAAIIDEDNDQESASARSVALHPGGGVLAGGAWVRGAGEVPAPYLRLGHEGLFSTTFAAPGPDPGWIDAVTVDQTGEVWALCVYEAGGSSAEVQLLRMECQL
jgi:hypothetical protein